MVEVRFWSDGTMQTIYGRVAILVGNNQNGFHLESMVNLRSEKAAQRLCRNRFYMFQPQRLK